jgi:putative nucleotidyltransferase with HDIG domain
MIEYRDPYTTGHEKRVGDVAAAIGRSMGFEESRINGLRIAGYLHDVGKIAIPAEILTKPGRLRAIERTLIQAHAEIGFDILSGIDFPWEIAEMVHQHHERLDGSGYPRGLRGDQILLEARILAVADVAEAMTSHRPYRPARGPELALEELRRGCGEVYDTCAVEACIRLFEEGRFPLA